MAAETERWELEIELPPVTEDVRAVLVKCGHTAVTVEKDMDGWAARQGSAVTRRVPDYATAIRDARVWVQQQERIRLLRNAAEPAVIRESGMGDGAGESHGC